MRRKAMIGWAVVAASLMLVALDSPSEAALGCFRDTGFAAATCDVAADCAPVGGVDCTMGACYCPGSATEPFCPCEALKAPALSQSGLLGSAVMVFAIGLFGLWRQTIRPRRNLA